MKPKSTLPEIVIDTREQRPYTFEGFATVRRTLPAGDYSLVGYETVAAVERKSLDDYVASIILQRARFLRECERLAGYELRAVVVEGGMSDILAGRYRSEVKPACVIGATAALVIDYTLPIIFCDDRGVAERFTLKLLTKFHERQQARVRAAKQAG